MIATIATVTLAAFAAAEPNFYATGAPCSLSNYQCVDDNSFCQAGNMMTCASGTVCGTPERPDWSPCIRSETASLQEGRKLSGRKLSVQHTLYGKCDFVTTCGKGMNCSGQQLGIFGTGFCVKSFF